MDLPSWIDDIEDVKSGLCVSNKDALSATLGDSITTPSASEWTDISFHCGAGSEEGDTFNYECVDCRSKHTSIEDLNSHLLTSAAHVVCPICVMEFSGQNNQVKEMSRKDHILKTHSNQVYHSQTQAGETPKRDEKGLYDFRLVSQDAANLAVSMGLVAIHGPEPQPDTNNEGLPSPASTNRCNAEASVSPRADEARGALSPVSERKLNNSAGKPGKDHAGATTQYIPKVTAVAERDGDVTAANYIELPSDMLYYHWEPDMQLVRDLDGQGLKILEVERGKEMDWLRGFEGA